GAPDAAGRPGADHADQRQSGAVARAAGRGAQRRAGTPGRSAADAGASGFQRHAGVQHRSEQLMELRWPGWFRRRSQLRLSRLGASAFQNSTLAELAWQRARNASTRWAIWGV